LVTVVIAFVILSFLFFNAKFSLLIDQSWIQALIQFFYQLFIIWMELYVNFCAIFVAEMIFSPFCLELVIFPLTFYIDQ
jgi:hypothetical protein